MVGLNRAVRYLAPVSSWVGRIIALAAVAALGQPDSSLAAEVVPNRETIEPSIDLDGSLVSYLDVGDTLSVDDDNPPIPE